MFLDQWLVAVAEHHYVGLHVVNLLLERSGKMLWSAENVNHEDAEATELDGLLLIYARRSIAFIDIARNSRHGGNPFKLLQHTQISNVTRVEDVAHSLEYGRNVGVKLSVCVGNDSDEVLTHGEAHSLSAEPFVSRCSTTTDENEEGACVSAATRAAIQLW